MVGALSNRYRVYSYGGLDAYELTRKLQSGVRYPGRKFLFVFGTCMLRRNAEYINNKRVEVLQLFERLHPGCEVHVCDIIPRNDREGAEAKVKLVNSQALPYPRLQCARAFVVANRPIAHYYSRDGLHFSRRGLNVLAEQIGNYIRLRDSPAANTMGTSNSRSKRARRRRRRRENWEHMA
jgi:hypothetical protein